MYFIFWYDYILLPIYLLIVILLLNRYFKKRHGHNPALKRHFKRALALKIIGCIAIGMIYEYYYNGAYDGRFYFECAKLLVNYWKEHPSTFFATLYTSLEEFNFYNLDNYNLSTVHIYAEESFTMSKLTALFSIFSFNTFLPCALLISTISFIAIWNLFIFFNKEYGLTYKVAGLATIYVPSILIWSSGIFKDTFTFIALCWMFICGYYAFIKFKKVVPNLLGFLIAASIISFLKVYILAAFAPFFIVYVFNSYKSNIKNYAMKILATPFILLISVGGVFLFLKNADDLLGRYALNDVLETASITAFNIGSQRAGSAYNMDVDFSSIPGLLKAIPAGINVTLFRPYPWEYLKPFTLLASAESMLILYFTLFIFLKIGIGKSFKTIWETPVLQFTLFYSLVFSFMVGISSSNFGSLVRYKIPALPFYILFLALLYHYHSAVFQSKTKKSIKKRIHQHSNSIEIG